VPHSTTMAAAAPSTHTGEEKKKKMRREVVVIDSSSSEDDDDDTSPGNVRCTYMSKEAVLAWFMRNYTGGAPVADRMADEETDNADVVDELHGLLWTLRQVMLRGHAMSQEIIYLTDVLGEE